MATEMKSISDTYVMMFWLALFIYFCLFPLWAFLKLVGIEGFVWPRTATDWLIAGGVWLAVTGLQFLKFRSDYRRSE